MLPPDDPADAHASTQKAATPPTLPFEPPERASYDSRVGTTLAARFELKRRLGEGGMGVVYEASDKAQSGAIVALKILTRLSPAAIYRLKNEFRKLAGVPHPNLVALYELFFHEGQWFFTMERVHGVHYDQYVRPQGACDFGRLTHTLRQLVAGVRALHAAGKLHRDLKPSNVLVTPEGRVVIVDFGLVRELTADPRDTDAGFAGTPAYAAPEQSDSTLASAAADWYAVGVMLYEALTGRVPFEGGGFHVMLQKLKEPVTPPSALLEGIPRELEQVCMALLQADPDRRAGALDILAALPANDTRPEAEHAPVSETFVGRTPELTVLSAAFDRVSQGRPSVVMVSGASGMGKTALVEQFLARLSASGRADVFRGRCYAHEQVPYKALDSIVDALSRHLRSMPPVRAAAHLPRDIRALAQLFPVLLRVDVVNEVAPRVIDGETDGGLRIRAFHALKQLLGTLSDRAPIVLFIDDLHWSDDDSVQLLLDLLSPPEIPTLLLIATYRDSERETNRTLRQLLAGLSSQVEVRPLELSRLKDVERRELAAKLLEAAGTDEAQRARLIDWVVRESDGHPLFMGELVRQYGPGGESEPVSLDAAILKRAEALDPSTRRMLQVLCAAGRPVDRSVALAAADSEDGSVFTTLRPALLARARVDGERVRFEPYHDRVREIIGQSLSEAEVKAIHERLGEATLRSDRPDLEAVVEHYLTAGREIAAARIAEDAALQAIETLAFQRAIRLLRLALTHASGRDHARKLQLKLAEICSAAAQNRDAARYLIDASADQAGDAAFDAKRKAMEHYFSGGHDTEGRALLMTLAREVGLYEPPGSLGAWLWLLLLFARLRFLSPPDVERAERGPYLDDGLLKRRVSLAYSAMAMHTTDPARAGYHLLQVLRLAPRVGAKDIFAVTAAAWVGFVGGLSGVFIRSSEDLLERVTRLADGATPHMRAWFHAITGASMLSIGDFVAARRHFERGNALASTSTGAAAAAHHFVRNGLVSCHFWTGELSDYFRSVDGFLRVAGEAEDKHFVVGMGTMGALRFLRHGDVAAAYAAYDDAVRIERPISAAAVLDPWWLAWIDLYAGDTQKAVGRFEVKLQGTTLIATSLSAIGRAVTRLTRASCAAANLQSGQDPKRMARIVRRDERALRRMRIGIAIPMGEHVSALRAHMEGKTLETLEHLRRGAEAYEQRGFKALAAALRGREGAMRGGEEGALLLERSRAFFREHDIESPERWTAMLAAGFSPHP